MEQELKLTQEEKQETKKEKKNKQKTPMDRAKKKKVVKRCVIGGIAVVVVGFFVLNSVAAKNAGTIVYTTKATVDDVEQTISTSGTVKSEESKTYFSPVAIQIGSVNVTAGDTIKQGDVLLAYDETALADARQIAELKLQASEGSYESSVSKDNKYIAELGEANINLDVLDQQIEDSENYVKELNKKIQDKKAALAYEGTLLQISLIDWSDKPDSEEYENLQKLIQLNTYEQQNNKDILAWQKEVSDYQDKIAAYKEYRSEMKSQKNSSENGSMDSGSRSQLEANTQMENINNNDTLTSIGEIENGLTADFDGVVTEVDAVEGSTPTQGMKLLTVESTEKVKVSITVSKYDLEKIAVGQEAEIDIAGKKYTGKVSRINGMATNNASGAAVVGADIEIDNPDAGIFLGVEAKVVVHTAKATGATVLPVEVINSDKEGDFVFVEENGVVAKKRIEMGISSDTYSEIKEGITTEDAVIITTGQELEEGMAVTAIPQ